MWVGQRSPTARRSVRPADAAVTAIAVRGGRRECNGDHTLGRLVHVDDARWAFHRENSTGRREWRIATESWETGLGPAGASWRASCRDLSLAAVRPKADGPRRRRDWLLSATSGHCQAQR